MLWVVSGILAISLAMFFLGKPLIPLSELNLSAKIQNPDNFFKVFAIIFPAFTGMTAGVGLSGDLKKPGHSIPLGTMAGTLIGMVIYIFIIIKMGMSATPANLAGDQFVMEPYRSMGTCHLYRSRRGHSFLRDRLDSCRPYAPFRRLHRITSFHSRKNQPVPEFRKRQSQRAHQCDPCDFGHRTCVRFTRERELRRAYYLYVFHGDLRNTLRHQLFRTLCRKPIVPSHIQIKMVPVASRGAGVILHDVPDAAVVCNARDYRHGVDYIWLKHSQKK